MLIEPAKLSRQGVCTRLCHPRTNSFHILCVRLAYVLGTLSPIHRAQMPIVYN